MILNEEQRAAVETDSTRSLVLAGAGAGKTRVLTHRVAYLLDHGCNPDELLAVTFTRKSANELKERLVDLVGHKGKHIVCGTFHSLCAGFIRRYAELSDTPITEAFSIYDTVDADLIKENVKEEVAPTATKKSLEPRMTWQDTQVEDHPERDTQRFRFWRAYHQRVMSQNALDFDSLLEFFFYLLESNADILGRHDGRFKHILIDEGQDVDQLQWALMSLAIKAEQSFNGSLFIVADHRQSIYKFRGADLKILEGLATSLLFKIFKMSRNYRSTIPIVTAANQIESAMDFPPELQTGGLISEKPGSRLSFISANLHRDEARAIAISIAEYIECGGSPSDIAILYRAHRQARPICEQLDEREIPYYRVGAEQDIWRHPSTRQIVRLLRLCCNPSDDQSFNWVVNWPTMRLDDLALAELRLEALENCSPLLSVAKERASDVWRASQEIDRDTTLIGALCELDSIMRLTDPGTYGERAIGNSIAIETMGEWAEPETETETDDAVITSAPTVGDFLDWFASRSMADEIKEEREAVNLMTVHAAKGLEFPIVYVINLEEGRFPNARKDVDYAEELRLFYVAVTRARDALYLSRSMEHSRGGKIIPSRFLEIVK